LFYEKPSNKPRRKDHRPLVAIDGLDQEAPQVISNGFWKSSSYSELLGLMLFDCPVLRWCLSDKSVLCYSLFHTLYRVEPNCCCWVSKALSAYIPRGLASALFIHNRQRRVEKETRNDKTPWSRFSSTCFSSSDRVVLCVGSFAADDFETRAGSVRRVWWSPRRVTSRLCASKYFSFLFLPFLDECGVCVTVVVHHQLSFSYSSAIVSTQPFSWYTSSSSSSLVADKKEENSFYLKNKLTVGPIRDDRHFGWRKTKNKRLLLLYYYSKRLRIRVNRSVYFYPFGEIFLIRPYLQLWKEAVAFLSKHRPVWSYTRDNEIHRIERGL